MVARSQEEIAFLLSKLESAQRHAKIVRANGPNVEILKHMIDLIRWMNGESNYTDDLVARFKNVEAQSK